MWKEIVSTLGCYYEYAQPAEIGEIEQAEAVLDVLFPPELRSLLQETNGVIGAYGTDVIWDVSRIVTTNIEFRTLLDFRELYMPFDDLLFFGDAGDGNQFAYAILDGQVRSDTILMWDHEIDSREPVAQNLTQYLQMALS
jgi:hypothetical protein